jgi:hypothetical protein
MSAAAIGRERRTQFPRVKEACRVSPRSPLEPTTVIV